jgi:methionyl-tRNA formyltransferase
MHLKLTREGIMKIICCAYRDWGLKISDALIGIFPEHVFVVCKGPDIFDEEIARNGLPDIILSIGWSWLFKKEVVDSCWVAGVHPSDLPNFSGGSPIQNQILAGVEKSKNTLFRITSQLDAGPIIGQLPLSLGGHMHEIFDRLVYTSIVLLSDFIRNFPDNLTLSNQVKVDDHKNLKRLKADSGSLIPHDFQTKTTKELYDFIRCREHPYPNAYLEDEMGTLYFQMCEWKERK